MYEFNYQRASSVADAAEKVAAGEDARLLAGGQTLIAAMATCTIQMLRRHYVWVWRVIRAV